MLPKPDYASMESALADACAAANLQPTEYFLLKVRARDMQAVLDPGMHVIVQRCWHLLELPHVWLDCFILDNGACRSGAVLAQTESSVLSLNVIRLSVRGCDSAEVSWHGSATASSRSLTLCDPCRLFSSMR